MNGKVISNEDELLEELQSSEAEVRRKAAEELGVQAIGDDREVSALMDVMQNDSESKVREMAYWALSSPANLKILSQHPDWQARIRQPEPYTKNKPPWWVRLLMKLKKL
jgi:HEAT repeat protein